MRHLSILIKPASGICNMKCNYCFYYDVMANRNTSNHGLMSTEILEEIVKKTYSPSNGAVSFVFQGGEPMLRGIDFYLKFIALVTTYNPNNIATTYAIQTNGTLINSEFALFFKKHNFLVGISIDGNQDVHNLHRIMQDDTNSFNKTLTGLKILQKYEVDYNILAVVTNETALKVEETYNFLKSLGTSYLQFIPCIDSFDSQFKGQELSNELYLEFLKELFKLWYLDYKAGKIISIRYFDDILKIIIGYYPESCTLQGRCINQNVIEADGSVYPCDFYVLDEWKIGNILENSFNDFVNAPQTIKFIQSSQEKHDDCMKCKYYQLCLGGCRRNKEPFTDVKESKTRFCKAIYSFFEFSIDRFIEIGEDLADIT